MSYSSFTKLMVGDELKELGYVKATKEEWVKIIDKSIFVSVWVQNLHGTMIFNFKIFPLFGIDPGYYSIMHILQQKTLAEGGDPAFSGAVLRLYDPGTDNEKKSIAAGKSIFAIIRPIIEGVTDLESAARAIQKADYLRCFYTYSTRLGREYTLEEHIAWPPEPVFFILCKLGKYREAADYLERDLSFFQNFQGTQGDPEFYESIRKNEHNRIDPLLQLVYEEKYDELERIMQSHYEKNCKEIEKNYKITISCQ